MSKTISSAPPFWNRITSVFACAFLLLLTAAGVPAQSTNVDQPTPVISNRVAGEILARDIGDSRLTRHFYVLTGMPGDLMMTVESRNLNGDVDLFQSGSLRPLAKVSVYAGEVSTSTSKSIYLRQRETIILRVEARTPNDDKGEYRITFSGGFEAMAAPAGQPETDSATEQPAVGARRGSTRRVSSVGARIEEPVEPAKTTPSETTSERADDSGNAASNRSSDSGATTTSPEPVTTARTQRPPAARGNRRGRGRATPARPPETATQNRSEPATAGEPPPAVVARPTGIEAGAKLVIETRDGMRVERFMNTVRRVTIENGQIVVFMRDGKITRHPMTNVLRMAIEP
jgi:hypothetical protein